MGEKRQRGKFGLRIRTYMSGSIAGYNQGVRDKYDFKEAMLTNSMFLNYMKEHGLNIRNGDSTRDIICIDFAYGTRSYSQEVKHLNKIIKDIQKDPKMTEEKKVERIDVINGFLQRADENRDKYHKLSADDIRIEFYNEGVDIDYYYHNRLGVRKVDETIHYKFLYRTPGKAKVGKANFIREELYEDALNYLRMGIELPKENAPIVEIGAYSSLITSTIDINIGDEGRIAIAPEEILILRDVDSYFNTKVISVETNDHKHCIAREIEDYRVKNTMFDGQALIDSSIFPKEANGYILLRQHFTKCAAFCTHIQKFFKDYYGDKYEDTYITDMFGRSVRAKDIRLITTDNAIKWLKFKNVSFDDWADRIREADNMWGIVKTAHPSKFGRVQRMSYQMINALDINTIENVCKTTLDYIYLLKTDDEVFLQYLRDNSNFSNDYEVLVALVNQNRAFLKCDYFRRRRAVIIDKYVKNFKTGKVMQEGDNLVIVGSPYAMLMYTVGDDPLQDPTFGNEDDCIQCWTSRFKDGEYLAEFRSPFNSLNNMGYLHNVYNKKFDEYFSLGDLCIAVNMNHTDFQDRNNGSDMDSDSIFTTNQIDIVTHARYCYKNYPTIVNNVPQEKNIYDCSMDSFAAVDNKLGGSQLNIGLSSNLAQIALGYSHTFTDKKYSDAVCILSVLAQISIDSAKKSYDMNLAEEINRLKIDIDVDNNRYPEFWLGIRSNFKKKRINRNLICPMNRLYDMKIPRLVYQKDSIPIEDFFVKFDLSEYDRIRKCRKLEELIQKYALNEYHVVSKEYAADTESMFLLRDDFENLIHDLRQTSISNNYLGFMSWMINRAFLIGRGAKVTKNVSDSKLNKNRVVLLKVLYELNPSALLKCLSNKVKT